MQIAVLPLALLLAVQHGDPTDSIRLVAEEIVAGLHDKAKAYDAGFRPPIEGRLVDRVPFQGEHWIHVNRVFRQYASSVLPGPSAAEPDLAKPTFVMFSPVGTEIKPVGLAYTRLLAPDEKTPQRLGTVDAPWHEHQTCLDIPGEGRSLAHGDEDCLARGGRPTQRRVGMVHVWTTPNPEGDFANYNPALPFLALGLTPPTSAALADPRQALRIRWLALALAEMYDARLPYARQSEHFNRSLPLAKSLARHRTAIAELVPTLRASDEGGRQAEYDQAVDQAIRHGKAMYHVYQQMAATPAVRSQLEAEYQRVLRPGHHR
jgi:hypothetical protein